MLAVEARRNGRSVAARRKQSRREQRKQARRANAGRPKPPTSTKNGNSACGSVVRVHCQVQTEHGTSRDRQGSVDEDPEPGRPGPCLREFLPHPSRLTECNLGATTLFRDRTAVDKLVGDVVEQERGEAVAPGRGRGPDALDAEQSRQRGGSESPSQ